MAVSELQTRLGGIPVFMQADWAGRLPWLTQGITARARSLDLRPLSDSSDRSARTPDATPWERLRVAAGFERLVRCRQVHGRDVMTWRARSDPGEFVREADVLVTDRADLLLTITVADCIPVFAVDSAARVLGLAHAGWRGIAAGVVDALLEAMSTLGANTGQLHLHMGPAICRRCYKVGPDVVDALGLPAEQRFVDLRGVVAERLASAGLDPERVTRSDRCTRCDSDRSFYSYRGGDRDQRMAAFLGRQPG